MPETTIPAETPTEASSGVAVAPSTPAAAPDPGFTPPETMVNGADTSDVVVTPQTWPDDWQERLAGKDEGKLKWLKRYASPENVVAAGWLANNQIKQGVLKPASLPENATEEELATYRKAWGVPDTVDGYEVKPPEGMQFSDVDKQDIRSFLETMHAGNAPKQYVEMAVASYFDMRMREEQHLYEAAQQNTLNNRATIKAEYGRDTENHLRSGNNNMVETLGVDDAKTLASAVLADGTRLGDYPLFVRYTVQNGLKLAGDEPLVTGDMGTGGKTVEQAYREAIDLRFDPDPAKVKQYHTPEHQAKMLRLAEAVEKRRTQSGRAA